MGHIKLLYARPADVLDREREWGQLAESVGTRKPGLVLVLGRRRAGKSYLLTRFVSAAGGLYYQATKKTDREQLLALSRALGERFDDAALRHVSLPDWDALLEYVVERAAGESFVLVLDEFPYLAEAAPALPSILQNWWDHRLENTRILIVLSGSHISAMKRLVEADQPLYGRRTGRVDIRPFDYLDAARFAPSWPPRDKLRMYAVLGGLPGHLSLVDPNLSLAENVAHHVLGSGGRLHDEAVHAFDAFLADAGVHYSILDAIASGERRWNRIATRVGKQTSALSRPLEWLLEMEVVEKVAPITEYPHPNPKRTFYRITDPYIVFWYKFVADVKERGLSALVEPETLWDRLIAPKLDDYMGPWFEEACRQFVARGRHSVLPFHPIQVGSWWSADSSEEIDVIALDGAGEMLAGECKWGSVGSRDLERLKRRAERVASEIGGIQRLSLVLFSAGGMEKGDVAARIQAGEARHVSIEALYEEGPPPDRPPPSPRGAPTGGSGRALPRELRVE